jgi:hypothetical protein
MCSQKQWQRYKKIIPFAIPFRRHTPSRYQGFKIPIIGIPRTRYQEYLYEASGMGFPDIRKTLGNNINGV